MDGVRDPGDETREAECLEPCLEATQTPKVGQCTVLRARVRGMGGSVGLDVVSMRGWGERTEPDEFSVTCMCEAVLSRLERAVWSLVVRGQRAH